jgi:hypothetical protein
MAMYRWRETSILGEKEQRERIPKPLSHPQHAHLVPRWVEHGKARGSSHLGRRLSVVRAECRLVTVASRLGEQGE